MSRTTSTHAAGSVDRRPGRVGYRGPLGAASWFFSRRSGQLACCIRGFTFSASLAGSTMGSQLLGGRWVDHHMLLLRKSAKACFRVAATRVGYAVRYAATRFGCKGTTAACLTVHRLSGRRHELRLSVLGHGELLRSGGKHRLLCRRKNGLRRASRASRTSDGCRKRVVSAKQTAGAQRAATAAAHRRGRHRRDGQQNQCFLHVLCLLW